MIIDAHNHPDWLGHDLERFLADMAWHLIDITWLLSWECPKDEFDPNYCAGVFGGMDQSGPAPFSRCLSYAERAPDKFVLGCAPDPRRPGAIDRLQALIDVYNVRVYGELKLRMIYDNPDALRMFRFCGEKGLPVVVHIDYDMDSGQNYPRPNWWYGGGIDAFERAVRACPDTIFLGHGPGFWSHISGGDKCDREPYPVGEIVPGGKVLEMLKRYPNLYCDLSAASGCNALKRDPEFARDFLIEFQDRVLYARDSLDGVMKEALNSLNLPARVRDKIDCGNALKLVPIEDTEVIGDEFGRN